ncbi:hypothetical protein SMU68_10068 [Streptococcus mutans NFSM1]|jgi:Bacteriocin class II with double-glycine leader peptide.|nr:hypothetical protein SMU68_10068 [Streptococcus mutans NFSM1]NLQ90475.1 bacteriocin [Streptococcus mutans]
MNVEENIMSFDVNSYNDLTRDELSQTIGGSRQAADTFLSGAYGAAKGVTACASTGVYVVPATLVACGVVGAGLNIAFPH